MTIDIVQQKYSPKDTRLNNVLGDYKVVINKIINTVNDMEVPEVQFTCVTNVKDYGAFGDGEHDDTLAIQRAIDDGLIVYLPAGLYRITSALLLRPGIHIYGESVISTKIYVDHTGVSHDAAFKTPTSGTDMHSFSIKHLWIVFDSCSANPAIGPSAHTEDIGIHLCLGPGFFLYEISDIRIGNAYWAIYDESLGFHGRIERVHSNRCRNGFYKWFGTSMVYDNCEVNGWHDITPNIDGYAYYLREIQGLVVQNCVCETWQGEDIVYLKDLRQANIINLYFEDVYTKTTVTGDTRLIFVEDCHGINFMGIVLWLSDFKPYNSSDADLLYITGGNGNILGVELLGAGGYNTCSGASTVCGAHMITFADTAQFHISGCHIEEFDPAVEYVGEIKAVKDYSYTTNILVSASYIQSYSGATNNMTFIETNLSKFRSAGIPVSIAGLSTGDVWSDSGILNIV
jgi:hypothetical protein